MTPTTNTPPPALTQVTVSGPDGLPVATSCAWQGGVWGATRFIEDDAAWTVTHLPTGVRATTVPMTQIEAIAAAQTLAKALPEVGEEMGLGQLLSPETAPWVERAVEVLAGFWRTRRTG